MEIYKDIQGYEGLYKISNKGNVKSLNKRKGRILKPVKQKNGYLRVDLCKQGKQKKQYVHRLVAQAFITNPQNLGQVNHKNEIKTDNRVENLEFCDSLYNLNYGTRNKRSGESRRNNKKQSKEVLCVETGKIYTSIMEVHRQLGLSKGHISSACLGKRNKCGGYTWRYV